MAENEALTINEFIKFDAAGLRVANFVQIRAALINRYKAIYGTDIDLSTGTADGVFVNDLALIINNLLQGMQTMYSNLDIDTAGGIYLDTLCALSNIYRKLATPSNASIQVTNTSTSATSTYNNLTFIDQSGMEWYYPGDISFEGNETKELTVICKESGEIEAPAGWIYQTLEVTSLIVVQEDDANIGTADETDTELRARRIQSSGAAGITVLEALVAALSNISGIDDVKIYNNNVAESTTAVDGTTIDPHSIYIILRKRAGITVEDSTIGNIVHEKLTPGIHSCDSSGTSGTAKEYVYLSTISGSTVEDSEQKIYWKEATPIAPQITFTITALDYFSTDEFEILASKMIKYMNELKIGKVPTNVELLIELTNADPKFIGNNTFTVGNISANITQSDTYYNYTTFEYQNTSGKTYTFTLK